MTSKGWRFFRHPLLVIRLHIQLEDEISSRSCLDVRILFLVFDDVAFEEECRPIVRDILYWEREFVLSFFVVQTLSRHIPTNRKVGDRE